MSRVDQRRQLVFEVLVFSTRSIRWKSQATWQASLGKTTCLPIQLPLYPQKRLISKTKRETTLKRMTTFAPSFAEATMQTPVLYHTPMASNLCLTTRSPSSKIGHIPQRKSITRSEPSQPPQTLQVISSNSSTSR